MNQIDEANLIRYKNIIDIAISFSGMNRVFEQGSKQKIAGKLESSFNLDFGHFGFMRQKPLVEADLNKYWSQFWSNIRRIGVNQCPFDAKIVDFRKWPKSS